MSKISKLTFDEDTRLPFSHFAASYLSSNWFNDNEISTIWNTIHCYVDLGTRIEQRKRKIRNRVRTNRMNFLTFRKFGIVICWRDEISELSSGLTGCRVALVIDHSPPASHSSASRNFTISS